jgi:hypothetical protein
MQANPCILFDSAQLKLILIKNLSIYPCKKYHLGTEHIIS